MKGPPDLELLDLMIRIGWERDELARRLGNAASTIGDWMSGRRNTDDRVKPWLRLIAAGVESAPRLPDGWAPRKPGRPG